MRWRYDSIPSPVQIGAASGWQRQPLEKKLIVQHQPLPIDHQVRFETGGQAQIDVAYSTGTLPVVALL